MSSPTALVLFAAILINILVHPVVAATLTQNVTVDDADLSITYSAGWALPQPGRCPGCTVAPTAEEIGEVHDGTWHDGTVEAGATPITAQLVFTGTAAYAFGFTINDTTVHPFIKNQDLSFTIDGLAVGSFVFNPVPSTVDAFNVPFLAASGLANGQHTLVMTANPDSYVAFDYFVYTEVVASTPESTSSSPSASTSPTSTPIGASTSPTSTPIGASTSPTSTPIGASTSPTPTPISSSTSPTPTPISSSTSPTPAPIGAIVGGVVGGVVATMLLIALLFLLLRLNRRANQRVVQMQLQQQNGNLYEVVLSPFSDNRNGWQDYRATETVPNDLSISGGYHTGFSGIPPTEG